MQATSKAIAANSVKSTSLDYVAKFPRYFDGKTCELDGILGITKGNDSTIRGTLHSPLDVQKEGDYAPILMELVREDVGEVAYQAARLFFRKGKEIRVTGAVNGQHEVAMMSIKCFELRYDNTLKITSGSSIKLEPVIEK